jgi:hypothetical protein
MEMKKTKKPTSTAKEQVNISNHAKIEFLDVIKQGLIEGGINFNAMKNSGKTRTLFSICYTLMTESAKFDEKTIKCIAFDGSESWLYGFSHIAVFDIAENDISLITEPTTTEDLERYQFNNWELIKLALDSYQHILFRLKSRRPSKRGFAIRQICLYLDQKQREQKEVFPNHEPSQRIAYFLDEIQDAFTMRASLRLDNEVFLSMFNEARNNYESFFSADIRETETAKCIRAKQINSYGKIPEMDKQVYHRRLEKLYDIDLSAIPQRTWFIEGKLFSSPKFKQAGKPFKINQSIREKWFDDNMPKEEPIEIPKKKSFMARFLDAIFPQKQPKIISQKEYDRLNDLSENLDEKEPIPEPKITKITKPKKPRAKKQKPKQEPIEPKVTMESLREVYSPDSKASRDYEAWKKKQLAEKKQAETENPDQSVYDDSKGATQENTDMEEDLALLDNEDMGW